MLLLSFHSFFFFVVFCSCPSLLLTPLLLCSFSVSFVFLTFLSLPSFSFAVAALSWPFLPSLFIFVFIVLSLYHLFCLLSLLYFFLLLLPSPCLYLLLLFIFSFFIFKFFLCCSIHRPPVALFLLPLTRPLLYSLSSTSSFFPFRFGEPGADSPVRRESKTPKQSRRSVWYL